MRIIQLETERLILRELVENEASRKTIVNAGGKLEREYKADYNKIVQLYWINL